VSAGEVVRRHIAAFNAGDVETLLAGFTDDAVWITGSSVARGREELAELFAGAIAGLRPALDVRSLVADAGRAACELVETLTVEGEPRTFHIAAFYELRDGRIASAKVYREGSAEIA
jgi:uncharacterized protein